MKKSALFGLVALTPMLLATAAAAQEVIATAAPEPVAEVVVQTSIGYRNRSEAVAPVLEYGSDYFQRFEPLTAGDAMKRVPSVTFLSDVLESDGARLRGLDPGYTQILINGEKVPGANADRSFFVDRIPAELIDHIEVVRSASANRSGDAIAGALNIVLRDAMAIDGGYLRAGAIRLNDGRLRETFGGVWGGAIGPGRLLLGASLQGRRNPKEKTSWRYDEPGADLNNIEDQTDVRNGTDYSVNADYSQELGGGDLNLSGFWVRTDRLQDEDSLEYNEGIRDRANLNLFNNNDLDILTDNWSLNGRYAHDMFGGKTTFRLGYAKITDQQNEFEDETEFDRTPNRFTHDRTLTDLDDSETTARVSHQRDVAAGKLELGVEYRKKQRDSLIREIPRIRFNLPGAIPAEDPATPVTGGDSSIEETRLDPYVMLSGTAGPVKWEAGVRYETTDVSIADRTVGANAFDTDYAEVLPSAHLRWSLSSEDRITASIARTVRRPSFDETSPALLEEEMGDNDLVGNPRLKPEKAWGFDLGYERRLGRQGVAGVNAFYRDVTDRIELASIGEGSAGAPARLMQPQNIGDGAVWGVEFDLSTPLTAFGLENTGVFLNYSWLDSDVNDVFGSRKFNSQSDYVFNTGFIQDLPDLGAAFGVTYRKQGDAYGRVIGEEVTTRYGGDLEIFVEKRLANKVTIRLTGSNLLNGKKQETFDKFSSTADQIARDYDEYERESEEAGPVYQLIMRVAF